MSDTGWTCNQCEKVQSNGREKRTWIDVFEDGTEKEYVICVSCYNEFVSPRPARDLRGRNWRTVLGERVRRMREVQS